MAYQHSARHKGCSTTCTRSVVEVPAARRLQSPPSASDPAEFCHSWRHFEAKRHAPSGFVFGWIVQPDFAADEFSEFSSRISKRPRSDHAAWSKLSLDGRQRQLSLAQARPKFCRCSRIDLPDLTSLVGQLLCDHGHTSLFLLQAQVITSLQDVHCILWVIETRLRSSDWMDISGAPFHPCCCVMKIAIFPSSLFVADGDRGVAKIHIIRCGSLILF